MPMDQETQRRMADLIMEEAAILRRRADREGVHVYLAKPTVRVRPNPQFLRATMKSVEQSNRIVEVNEMWRRRDAELEGPSSRSDRRDRDRDRHRGRDRDRHRYEEDRSADPHRQRSRRDAESARDRSNDDVEPHGDTGLRDDELDRFLHSRVKRGRGAVGSRMDETGPYPSVELPPPAVVQVEGRKEEGPPRIIGPQLPEQLDLKKRKLMPEDENRDGSTSLKSKKHKKDKKRRKERG